MAQFAERLLSSPVTRFWVSTGASRVHLPLSEGCISFDSSEGILLSNNHYRYVRVILVEALGGFRFKSRLVIISCLPLKAKLEPDQQDSTMLCCTGGNSSQSDFS